MDTTPINAIARKSWRSKASMRVVLAAKAEPVMRKRRHCEFVGRMSAASSDIEAAV